MTFRKWLRITAKGEVLKHSLRRCFPATNCYRDLKRYLNSTYKRKYLTDKFILEVEGLYEEFMESESYNFRRI